jgi:hypothetical protein
MAHAIAQGEEDYAKAVLKQVMMHIKRLGAAYRSHVHTAAKNDMDVSTRRLA